MLDLLSGILRLRRIWTCRKLRVQRGCGSVCIRKLLPDIGEGDMRLLEEVLINLVPNEAVQVLTNLLCFGVLQLDSNRLHAEVAGLVSLLELLLVVDH